MKSQNILIGADPEFFLQCRDTGQVLSAIGKVGGSKKEPLPVAYGAVQEDGVLAEINIDPARNVEEFIFNLEAVTEALQGIVGDRVNLLSVSYATLSDQDLEDPRAWEIGCDPDINAWTGEFNMIPRGYRDGRRVAGGHIHVGYDQPTREQSLQIVQMLDYCVGLPSLMDEPDTFRRNLYGKAGSCRLKSYGVEYRTLGNYWLQSAELMAQVYHRTVHAVRNVHLLPVLTETLPPDLLRDLINYNTDPAVSAAYYQDVIRVLGESDAPVTF